jgi:isoquinoline 1-oxidoreductase beta subunit
MKSPDIRSLLSRRSFVVSAGIAAGALAVGFRFTPWSRRGDTATSGGEIFNWVVVAPDNNVTIRIAQMEMGQGAMTAMAQLIAEELEVDWSKIKTEFISITTHLNRGAAYGRVVTVGSEAVSRSQLLLRTVGAQIRTMLVRAAARRIGAVEKDLVAEDSVVTHVPTGLKLTYAELAADAATISVPDPASIRLKDPADWKFIGQSLPRVEIPAKVSGTAIYCIDTRLPGMKCAAVAMSPVFGGTLKSFNAGAALARPGVHRVVELDGAIAVVAEHWWQAKTALDQMPKEWNSGDAASIDSSTIATSLHAALNRPPNQILRNDGDVESAVKSAMRTLEAEYFVPYLEHATMEPMNCTALVNDRTFEVWAPTQLPEFALKAAAEVAGLPVSNGTLHIMQIGCGLGRRQESDFVVQAVQIARAMKGTPVKLLWSREDTTQHGFYRPAILSRFRGDLDQDGNLTAWTQRIAASSDDRVRTQFGSDSLLYAIPNMHVGFSVGTSHVPEGQMRGVGFAAHGFMTQSFIDELARAAGKDTYEFQRTLLDPVRTPGFVPTPTVEGQITHRISPRERAARLRAVLDEAARKADWARPLGQGRGRGIATQEQADAYYAVVVEVTLDDKDWFTVDRVVVAGDPGFLVNPHNADAQIEGSIAFALTSAIYGEITIEKGRVAESNFFDYKMLRMDEMPPVEIYWLLSRTDWGGIGDPAVAPVIPALTNAIYDAGGPRIRSLPLKNHKIVKRAAAG